MGRARQIRKFCVMCMGNSPKLVAKCSSPNCPLFVYRFGRTHNEKGTISELKPTKEEKGIEVSE